MLVGTSWLEDHLGDPHLRVVDLRWREDGSGRARYEQGHIPGAVFLDWATDIVDPDHRVAFMLAPPERFAAVMERCGIGDGSHVVAYADDHGSGPHRLWWACRVYGHDEVSVLDGGLEKWLAERRPVSTEIPRPKRSVWTPRPREGLVASLDDVKAAGADPGTVVLDSRLPEQFRGEQVWFETGSIPAGPDGIARTPRGDLRAGRLPWAVSVPVLELYDPNGTMKSPEELRAQFERAGVRPGCRAITYCGVGISASALLFALVRAGFDGMLYDGSWDEWSREPDLPVARG